MSEDMSGKHVAITGPTAGIGRTSAHGLARRGARLTLLCRSAEKGEALAEELAGYAPGRPRVVVMDMASLESVRQAATGMLESGDALDVLLNNAGIVNTSRRETVDGFEETLAVNHFAPFLLTGMVLPLVLASPGARIVNVASEAHNFVRGMGFEDMQATQGFKTFREYGRSKLANILFTRTLAARLQDRDVTVNCLHPGAVSTALGTQNKGVVSKVLPLLLKPFFKTPEQGAQTSLYLCCSPDVADVTGRYFANCRQRKPKPWAMDDAAAAQLWEFTEDAVGFAYDDLP